jgi:hypothetical protein
MLSACGGEDDEDSPQNYACRYETRHGACNQMAPTGAFTAGCFQFDANSYNISPSQVCTNVTRGGTSCSSSCCVVTEYRNVSLGSGSC